MRILVVEDEVALRDDLKTRLIHSGFGVDVASDGEEGLFAGLNYPLDAAIVDIGLPLLSGLEVIHGLRMKNRVFPILVLTGRSGWRNRVDGLRAGAGRRQRETMQIPGMGYRIRDPYSIYRRDVYES